MGSDAERALRSLASGPASRSLSGMRAFRFRLGFEEFALLSYELRNEGSLPAFEDALSPSEQIVANLALEGYSNLQIARVRATSVRTVANQIGSIFQKLGVKSRRELCALSLLGKP
jgi:DNA-binding CsgD family transcriptional regulator